MPADPAPVRDPTTNAPPQITVGSSTTTADPHPPLAVLAETSYLVAGSQTAFAGGDAITVSGGTVVSFCQVLRVQS